MREVDGEDIRTLTLSYTGTTQDAAEARKHSRAVMDEQDEDDDKSKIRDWTGSGVEHKPGQKAERNPEVRTSPRCQRRRARLAENIRMYS